MQRKTTRFVTITTRVVEEKKVLPPSHQDLLIAKMNTYLRSQVRRPLQTANCHGLALLWLKRMAARREKEFYAVVNRIIACPEDKLQSVAAEIEKLRKSINKKQNPQQYQRYRSRNIRSGDIGELLGLKWHYILDGVYTRNTLESMLGRLSQNEDLFCVTSDYAVRDKDGDHTIGIFRRGDLYYRYDSNSLTVEAQCFDSPAVTAQAILDSLYTTFNMQIPDTFRLEITRIRPNLFLENMAMPTLDVPVTQQTTGILSSAWSAFWQWAGWTGPAAADPYAKPPANSDTLKRKVDSGIDNDQQDKKPRLN